MISDGSMALRMLIGIPSQPSTPNVQMMVTPAVMSGITAGTQLRMNSTTETTSISADSGPSRMKSWNSASFNSTVMRGGPTCTICSKWLRPFASSASSELYTRRLNSGSSSTFMADTIMAITVPSLEKKFPM